MRLGGFQKLEIMENFQTEGSTGESGGSSMTANAFVVMGKRSAKNIEHQPQSLIDSTQEIMTHPFHIPIFFFDISKISLMFLRKSVTK